MTTACGASLGTPTVADPWAAAARIGRVIIEWLVAAAVAIAGIGTVDTQRVDKPTTTRTPAARIEWRDSVAVGLPESGRLVRGVKLPAQARGYFTWDPVLRRRPGRDWRRWGTDELVRTTLRVLRRFRRRHPAAPPVGIGDLSLPDGGYFGPEVGGGIGHATHQNGLDVDVYYPRLDRRRRPPRAVDQVDVSLAQELVDLFVEAGAVTIYVGPNLPLAGPSEVVVPLVNHDNHLHARIAP